MIADDRDRLVSVVMIFRNAEKYFDEAIQSVLSQGHGPLELLLCDDGSDDPSTDVARAWAEREPDRVRYLEHPGHAHRGMSATRNLGIAEARGRFVAFLDADDVWQPEHLQRQVHLLEHHPEADIVCGAALDWYSWDGNEAARDSWSPLPWPPGTAVGPPRMLSATLRRGAYSTPICSLLIRKSALDAAGGPEDSFTGMFEDQALLAKLHLSCTSVISGDRTALYRRHEESASARAMRDGQYRPEAPNQSMERFLTWLESYLPAQPAGDDAELRAALADALRPYRESRTTARPPVRARAKKGLQLRARRLARGLAKRAGPETAVRMTSLWRSEPLSRQFGFDRGLPIDRHYVEQFLDENAHLVAGRVLEVGDAEYTRRFGGSRVSRSDVLNIADGHPETTVVADLADGAGIPSDAFDCVVLTQTLHLLYDLQAATRTLHRILRPGGVLLATFPGISPLSTDQWAPTWHWALTQHSAARLFGDVFGSEHVEVATYGNVLTSSAFLYGMAAHELRPEELRYIDPQFPMLISVRAARPAGRATSSGT